ncbi:F-box/LRR-repeat protein At3g26922-like [Cannabis sativa]|uniref:F-box/LRR-repeat protein At3g26922-like n=1 Tax=Cannabis sativa TaxID=3483 RepID=UPI0029CA00F9|nr:F-box/LRR-repeat protein At3g26922-like [Cannabis sativa]XP_060965784.1 F-box/LRR-repeat protein At3g26922-like [Cannabis sativa]
MDNDNMNLSKRRKRQSSSSLTMVDGNDGEDRISKLPNSVIVHILSFLKTENVVPTCVLSKRWKFIWYSVPTIFFSMTGLCSRMDTAQYLEWQQDPEKFYIYVEKYLEHRKKGMYFIENSISTSFKLEMFGYYKKSKAGIVDKWLAFAVENKVKEINLSIGRDKDNGGCCYCLPKILVNATYLTILELCGVGLNTSHSFNFPSLKTLSLEYVWLSHTAKEDVVVKFLLGCHSLEKLQLCRYEFLHIDGKLRLGSLSLKFLELEHTINVDDIKVEAINLESLVLRGASVRNINFSACKKIRNLLLDDTSDEFEPLLHTLLANNPLLENLTLIFHHLHENHLKISGKELKSFNFTSSYFGPCNITIESAPKLAYFCYEGHMDLSISIEPSISLSGKIVILEGETEYVDDRYEAAWFTDMLNFLLNLNCSWNTISLHVVEYEALIWPEKLKRVCRSPLLNWKHLKVITKCSNPKRISDLKDSLMWISPSLETLSINEKHIF